MAAAAIRTTSSGVRLARQPRNVIDVGVIHDVQPEGVLEKRHDDIDVQSESQAERDAERGTDPADEDTLRHEYREHAARAQPERAQNRDVGALVAHDHHEGGHDVEHRHRHDQHEDQSHHRLLDVDGAKIRFVLLRPIAQLEPRRQARCGGARQFGRPQHVVELQADAGRTRQTAKRLRILEIDEGQHAVVLLQPDLEEPHHLEFLQPRHDGAAGPRRPES